MVSSISEFQQVAALLCLDIDILEECIDDSMSKEDILWQVRDLIDKKNDMINNEESRNSRYSAASMLMRLSINKG